ncbi:unnamed protein product [Paramecium pentaurelia]|uniref:Uncharacterized protein n=1 Tax=Paramecium pentaurelia TaxID=43138 RepID=A0A8S1YGR0_9CILI|nr:unnamed protein product [Paramecium pentaurelia]
MMDGKPLGFKYNNNDFSDQYETSQIMTNIEQINYLTWQGERSHSFQKIGRWAADWNWNYEGVGGVYSDYGQKQSQWKEMTSNFGEIKTWNYVQGNNRLQNSFFENQRWRSLQRKQGKNIKWIELSDSFSYSSQITYNGEYQDGKKFGVQTTMYRGYVYDEFIQKGGAQFDENQKNGEWIELSNYFSDLTQVIYQGHYLLGKKSGQWDTMPRLAEGQKFVSRLLKNWKVGYDIQRRQW